ncbi:MAG: hypothetical protein A3K19_24770 [Lentisphaerae bacterium RIFOXYB12_FULL_65_16]|nr:MAG: hypothetical protein A3K18_24185 [Lentisphaerae bacterium RIFOXYA12_64_32]OGV90685.1 MAG: hypothetical protein A3K19_24770 [Lentisphaerae bacterium RIFOXYB12_FULL_65_16]
MSAIHARGDLPYRCKCGYSELIRMADFSFQQTRPIPKGPDLGSEICHMGAVTAKCANCGEECLVEIDLWEYPVGAIDAITSYCEGCQLLMAKETLRRFISLKG